MKDQHGDIRRSYSKGTLNEQDLVADPLAQFEVWLSAALAAELTDATAMAVATADAQGIPSVRIVLLKHHDADGFVFYTDYRSAKGQDIAKNPQAELLFYWREFERQVRVNGTLERVPRTQSDRYFRSRPRASQLATMASIQSAPIDSRQTLEGRYNALDDLGNLAKTSELAAPQEWGGYCLRPLSYEFWQGRENRLHDRFKYTQHGAGWAISRLQP